jgi:hypothetical protein
MNATIPDVDLQRGFISLRRTKSGKSRAVPINDLARTVLDAMQVQERKQKKDRGALFRGITPAQLSMKSIRACRDAGVEDFSLHDLRHSYASWLRMKGADLLDIKDLLGHSDLRLTAQYAHLSQAHLLEASARLNGVFRLPAPGAKSQIPRPARRCYRNPEHSRAVARKIGELILTWRPAIKEPFGAKVCAELERAKGRPIS